LALKLVILSGALHRVVQDEAKDLLVASPQEKQMLRGVYPERTMKGILRFAQNDKRRASPE